jgi:hypothetical protein
MSGTVWTTIALRMKHTTPNSPSNALFVAPEVDQWSAPEHAIAHVLAHVRTTSTGSKSMGGSVHLN